MRKKKQNKQPFYNNGFKPLIWLRIFIELLVISFISTSGYALYNLYLIAKG